jgi:hypothetical protein
VRDDALVRVCARERVCERESEREKRERVCASVKSERERVCESRTHTHTHTHARTHARTHTDKSECCSEHAELSGIPRASLLSRKATHTLSTPYTLHPKARTTVLPSRLRKARGLGFRF